MVFTFIPSTAEQLAQELAIINSNPSYNRLSKGKEVITESELQAEHAEAAQLGARRMLICLDGTPIGIVEWLPLYPQDGYPWLGLFMIDGNKHRTGYGELALKALEQLLIQQHIRELRLVVLVDNEPAHRFWKKQQFRYIKPTVTHEGLDAIIYEKQL